MDPTALPTDNLYKFMALAGLGIAGFCLWFWWTRWRSFLSEDHRVAREAAVARERMAASSFRTKRLDLALDANRQAAKAIEVAVEEAHEKRRQAPPNDLGALKRIQRSLNTWERELGERQGELDRLASTHEQNRAKHERLVLVLSALDVELESRIRERARLMTLRKAMVVSGAVGLTMAASGFSLWYLKAQWFIDQQTMADFEDHMAELAEKRAEREEKRTLRAKGQP